MSVAYRLKNLDSFASYTVALHKYNNVDDKCKYVGKVFNPKGSIAAWYGSFETNQDGDSTTIPIRGVELEVLSNDSIIGRSCVIEKRRDLKCDRGLSQTEATRSRSRRERRGVPGRVECDPCDDTSCEIATRGRQCGAIELFVKRTETRFDN